MDLIIHIIHIYPICQLLYGYQYLNLCFNLCISNIVYLSMILYQMLFFFNIYDCFFISMIIGHESYAYLVMVMRDNFIDNLIII